jgi:hypothetical protein
MAFEPEWRLGQQMEVLNREQGLRWPWVGVIAAQAFQHSENGI